MPEGDDAATTPIPTRILANAGRYYGLGQAWQRLPAVEDRRCLH